MKELLQQLFLKAKASSGQTFADVQRRDPYANFNYTVQIIGKHGFMKAGFQEVSGLDTEVGVIEYRDGDDSQLTVQKVPALITLEPVTMRRGMSEDMDMYNWMVASANTSGDGHKNTIIIELMDRGRKGVVKWTLGECWISKYTTGDLNGQGEDIMFEEMVIQYETLKREDGDRPGAITSTFS